LNDGKLRDDSIWRTNEPFVRRRKGEKRALSKNYGMLDLFVLSSGRVRGDSKARRANCVGCHVLFAFFDSGENVELHLSPCIIFFSCVFGAVKMGSGLWASPVHCGLEVDRD